MSKIMISFVLLINIFFIYSMIEYEFAKARKSTKSSPIANFNDPLYKEQWALGNHETDFMNIQKAWNHGYSGKNVTICIVDDGVDATHPDLKRRFRSDLSYDFNGFRFSGNIQKMGLPYEGHGTKCAGIAAAEANNGVCGVGVAYGAYISAIRLPEDELTSFTESQAISYGISEIDIKCFSWGPDDDYLELGAPRFFAAKSLERAATKGRNGLGTLMVWASGNGGSDDHGGADGYHTNPYVLAFTSVKQNGEHEVFAEPSPCVFGATYAGNGISKTNNTHLGLCTTAGTDKCECHFGGTSAAAPMAAGILALVLEANPRLSYRDIMHIIAQTSLKPHFDSDDENWITNGAGFRIHEYIGFGTLDAMGMIERALEWTNVPKQIQCGWFETISTNKSTFTNGENRFEWKIRLTNCGIKKIEHVMTLMSINAEYRGAIKVTLKSPLATETTLLSFRRKDQSTKNIWRHPFTTNRCWGEDPSGVWTIRVFITKPAVNMPDDPYLNEFIVSGHEDRLFV